MGIKFVLPTLKRDEMTVGEQYRLLQDQATAVMFKAYLEYAYLMYIKTEIGGYGIQPGDINNVVNHIQEALGHANRDDVGP